MEKQSAKGSSYAWAIAIACVAFYAVPLGELLQEAIDEFDQREAKKAEAARRLEKAQEQKALVEKQLAEMKKEAATVSTAALAQD